MKSPSLPSVGRVASVAMVCVLLASMVAPAALAASGPGAGVSTSAGTADGQYALDWQFWTDDDEGDGDGDTDSSEDDGGNSGDEDGSGERSDGDSEDAADDESDGWNATDEDESLLASLFDTANESDGWNATDEESLEAALEDGSVDDPLLLESLLLGTTDLLTRTLDGTTDLVDALVGGTTVVVDETVTETTVVVDESTGETAVLVNESTHNLTDAIDEASDDELANVTVVVDGAVSNATEFATATTNETTGLVRDTTANATDLVDNSTREVTGTVDDTTTNTTALLDAVIEDGADATEETAGNATAASEAIAAAVESDLEGETLVVDGESTAVEAVVVESTALVRATGTTTAGLSVELVTETGERLAGTLTSLGNSTVVVLDDTLRTVGSTTDDVLGTTEAVLANAGIDVSDLDAREDPAVAEATPDDANRSDERDAETDDPDRNASATTEKRTPGGVGDAAQVVAAGLAGLAAASTASGALGGGGAASAGGASGTSVPGRLTGRATTVARRIVDGLSALPLEAAALLRYSRYDDSDPLAHDQRKAIYESIEADPGLYLSEVGDRNEVSLSTVRHHVRILADEGLVTTVKVHGKRRYFPVGEEDVEVRSALAEPAKRRVLEVLAECGTTHNGRLADELDVDPSTISHHLSSLESDGLVVRERDGRSIVNRLAPHVAAVLRNDGTADAGTSPAPADD